jgi:hypothetical protein
MDQLTPQDLAFIADQKAAQRKAFLESVNATTVSMLYSMLLDKWLIQHGGAESYDDLKYPKPTANDLRWIGKLAAHFAPFAMEAAGLIRIKDPKLEVLDGIANDNLLEFSGLMSLSPEKEPVLIAKPE